MPRLCPYLGWLLAIVLGCGGSGTSAGLAPGTGAGNGGSSSGSDSGDPGTAGSGGASDSAVAADASVPESCSSFPISDADFAARMEALGAKLDALIAKFEHDHKGSGGSIGCPGLGQSTEQSAKWGTYAFAKLARGNDVASTDLARSAVSCMFTYQDNKTGGFRFHVDGTPNPSDNATEFALQPVGWLLTRGVVPEALLTTLAPQIRKALDAVDAHSICPNYTNICILQQAVRISIGAAFAASSDPQIAADGAARLARGKSELADWISSAKTGGVREFDSPNYAEVTLEALALAHQGAVTAKDGETRARVDGIIDFLWSDYAANFFPSRGALVPPYSRNYDFAGGQGPLSYALWLEGLADAPFGPADPTMTAWLFAGGPDGHRPPARALCLSTLPAREVVSSWQQSGKTARGRYAYVTPDFALGSATSDYVVATANSDQDCLIGGALVSGPTTPILSVIPDWLDSPFSPIAIGDFSKATHLPLDPAVVQKEGALLLLSRTSAADPGYMTGGGAKVPLVNLTTNLVVPAMIDTVLVDGAAIDPSKTGQASAKPIVVVQNRTGAIAMAVIEASGLDCVNAAGTSITETGSAHSEILPASFDDEDPALRIAIRHLDSPPADTGKLASCFARLALLVVARHCEGPHCAAELSSDVSKSVAAANSKFDSSTGAWSVSVQAPSGPLLHVARGTLAAGDVSAREADGKTPSFGRLSVNGAAIPLLP